MDWISFTIGMVLGLLLAGALALYLMRQVRDTVVRLEEQHRQLSGEAEQGRELREVNAQLRLALAEIRKEQEAREEKLTWLTQAERQMREAFEALSSRALRSNAESYLQQSKQQLDALLVRPLTERLQLLDRQVREMEEKREGAYKGLQAHLGELREAYTRLQDTTTGLVTALTRSSSARGSWGELALHRIVELAGMAEHVSFEEQVTGPQGGRPDMVIYLPNEGAVAVDAKTTLETYRTYTEARGDTERRTRLQAHAQAVRTRIRELGAKAYWDHFEHAPEFVVMFLPHDGLLGAAFEGDKDLLDYAFGQKVLLATPVTLLALLKTVAYGWQQQAVAENVPQIVAQGRELHDRMSLFIQHFGAAGQALQKAVAAYNKAVGSLETRLIPSARRLRELGVSTAAEEPPPRVSDEVRVHTPKAPARAKGPPPSAT